MTTAKYLSVIKTARVTFCLITILLFTHRDLYPQTYQLRFRDVSLSEALISISAQMNVKVAFDSKRLGAITVNKDVTGDNSDEVISNLLEETGFTYRLKYNRYLIVDVEFSAENDTLSAFQVIGSVSDKLTGEQLPYASIIVPDQNIITSTSANGSFSLCDVSSNTLHLQVTYIGYAPLDTTFILTDGITNIDLRLNNTFLVLDSVLVEVSRTEMIELRNDVDLATTINTAKLGDLPAFVETDVFRMLQVLPGISYGENAQGLSIRGGSTGQNLVLFDGQTLYNLSHYYGVVSALNPNIIKDIQVYKGGYDSRFGERVSGIVDITGKSGSQSGTSVYGDLNLLSANLTAEVPVGEKISVIGAVRRSYSDLYLTQLSKNLYDRNMDLFRGDSSTIISLTNPRFYFYDYNAKISFRPSNVESFALSLYGGADYFRNSYSGSSHDLAIDETDINTWNNHGISASWLRQWNESFFTSVQTGTSGYDNVASSTTTIDRSSAPETDSLFLPDKVNEFNLNNRNSLQDYFFSAKNSFQFTPDNQMNFGFLARKTTIYYHKDADREYVYDNLNQSGWILSSYIQDRITLDRKLVVKPGIRFTYFNNNNRFYAEPRISANYRISKDFSVRLAAGKYFQFLNQVAAQQETGYNKYFWVLADNETHPVVSSNHFIGGLTFEKGRFLLDIEAYYKTYRGIQEYIFVSQFLKNTDFHDYFPRNKNGGASEPPPPKPLPSFFITGTGHAYGVDLMLRYKARRYSSWLSYSPGRSFQNFAVINGGDDIPAPEDQPYQLSWTNMISTGKLNIGTMTLWSAGRPYINSFILNNDQSLTRQYRRLQNYFRTDISVNYDLKFGKSRIKPGIALINIFNTHNYFDINTRRFDFESVSFSEATIIQSQAFSINAFIHFRF